MLSFGAHWHHVRAGAPLGIDLQRDSPATQRDVGWRVNEASRYNKTRLGVGTVSLTSSSMPTSPSPFQPQHFAAPFSNSAHPV